jgi:hypothetical protein
MENVVYWHAHNMPQQASMAGECTPAAGASSTPHLTSTASASASPTSFLEYTPTRWLSWRLHHIMRSMQLSHWDTCQAVGDMLLLLHVDSPSIQQLLRLLHRLLQSHNSAHSSAGFLCQQL